MSFVGRCGGYLLLFGQTIRTFEYIRYAKRLNSGQARWALYFGRFDFSISYRNGFQEHQT